MGNTKQQNKVKIESTDLKHEHELRVLVVDDDSAMTESYSLLLNSCGFDPHVCVHGVEAMEMIERLRPHVVLLDLSMPGLDGFGIAEELQHNPDLRPILLIANTGYSDDAHRIKTAAAGFDHHLVKPVHWDELRTILHDCETKLRSSLGDEAPKPNNPR
jgi:CheY-like chemotaxis protein